MPRIPRIDRPGERHHITNRASLKRAAFRDDDDRRFFLWILRELSPRFDVDVEAFCLMTTHYHLILAGAMSDVSAAMHRVGFLYTQYFNDRHDVDGPLFSDRYYSNPVHDEEYQRNAVRYIHRNPLAIDETMDLARYRWSSHAAYLGLRALDFVVAEPALDLFGGSRDLFRSFVECDDNDLEPATIRKLREVVSVATGSLPTSTAGEQRVARALRRQLTCLVASEVLRKSNVELADELGVSASTVGNHLARARERSCQDAIFNAYMTAVVDKLGPVPALPSWWHDSWGI